MRSFNSYEALPKFFKVLAIVMVSFAFVHGALAEARTLEGTLEVLIVESGKTSKDVPFLTTSDGQRIELVFRKGLPVGMLSGDRVRVTADIKGKKGYVTSSRSLRVLTRASTKALTGARKAVALVVEFSDAPAATSTASVANVLYHSKLNVAKYFEETSANQITFVSDPNGDGKADVFGPFKISAKLADSCNTESWANAADTLAAAQGVNFSLYQHRIYILPRSVKCNWAGLGYLGCYGKCRSWVKGNYHNNAAVYAHELGHNLGLHHASTDSNNDGRVDSEYGDKSCMMASASGWKHFNGPHTAHMGWFNPNGIVTADKAGTYTVTVSDNTLSATPLLKVKNAANNTFYYVSFRQPVGEYSSSLPSNYRNRTSIHTTVGARTLLVKTLGNGESFVDNNAGLKITQETSTVSEAKVVVSYFCVQKAPVISIASPEVYTNQLISKSIIATISDGNANCPSTNTYSLSVKAPTNFSARLSSQVVKIAPGKSAQVSLYALPGSTISAISDGKYTFTLTAIQQTVTPDGKVSGISAQKPAYYVYDRTPLPAITNLFAHSWGGESIGEDSPNNDKGGVGLSLYWGVPSSGTGAGAAHYLVYRNKVKISQTASTYFQDANAVANSSDSYYVVSVDRAGNISQQSNIVSPVGKGSQERPQATD